jgi:hypothetical protein
MLRAGADMLRAEPISLTLAAFGVSTSRAAAGEVSGMPHRYLADRKPAFGTSLLRD